MTSENALDALDARLAASRVALLSALEGVTEREFMAPFDGERSLVVVLAELAIAERAAIAAARDSISNLRVPEKPLAPQVIHDLAGARYGTMQLIAEMRAAEPAVQVRVHALVHEIAERERVVADRLAERVRD